MCEGFEIEAFGENFAFGNISAINFVNCTYKENELILALRNSDEIRFWMFKQNTISSQEHLSFIEALKDSKERLFFLIKEGEEYIGVIYFTHIDFVKQECFVGLYANFKNPQKQKGTKLISLIFQISKEVLCMNRIFLDVFTDNDKAIKLYENSGFVTVQKSTHDTKPILVMTKLL